MSLPKIYVVLPAYNEEKSLGPLLARPEDAFSILARLGHERHYACVDDRSRDATARILEEERKRLPMTVVAHETNRGLGAR